MDKIGYGYGSEWHLLRYLGYHRYYLNEQILHQIGGDRLDWLDFRFSIRNAPLQRDREWTGIEFIEDQTVIAQWHAFWPGSGSAQNWDAIGKVYQDGEPTWLLVEAKAHLGEVESTCRASSTKSREKIRAALEKAQGSFCASPPPVDHWLTPYYQMANRLACLHFLMRESQPPVPAHLLFVYFVGDQRADADCPQSAGEWEGVIERIENRLALDPSQPLMKRVHHLFLAVNPKV
jgi:hypothetical protein